MAVDARCHSKKNEMLTGEDGRCFHCGKYGLVVYYMSDLPKTIRQRPSHPQPNSFCYNVLASPPAKEIQQ